MFGWFDPSDFGLVFSSSMTRTFSFTRSALVLFGLGLFGMGCPLYPNAPTSPLGDPSSTSVREVIAPVHADVATCIHPYYPLREGYRARYEIRARDLKGVPQVYAYTQRAEGVTATSVHLVTNFEAQTGDANSSVQSQQRIYCQDGALRVDAYVDLGSRLLDGAMSHVHVQTERVTGELLPPNLQVGSAWDGSFELSMIPTKDATTTSLLGKGMEVTIHTHRVVEGVETVTVPAGTFEALKVRVSTDFSAGEMAMSSLQATEWWVKDKGLVKSVYAVGGTIGDIVTVATEIVAP